jgi:hypothetical protein
MRHDDHRQADLVGRMYRWLIRSYTAGRLPCAPVAADRLARGDVIGLLVAGERGYPRSWRFDVDPLGPEWHERGVTVVLLQGPLAVFLASASDAPFGFAGTSREVSTGLVQLVSAGLLGDDLTPEGLAIQARHMPLVQLPVIGPQRVVAIDGAIFWRQGGRGDHG